MSNLPTAPTAYHRFSTLFHLSALQPALSLSTRSLPLAPYCPVPFMPVSLVPVSVYVYLLCV